MGTGIDSNKFEERMRRMSLVNDQQQARNGDNVSTSGKEIRPAKFRPNWKAGYSQGLL